MAYSSQADVQVVAGGAARLRELSDFENAGAIDPAVVEQAITHADAWIDTFVQMRFAVPLETTPGAVNMLSANEAIYQMRKWRGMATPEDDDDHEKRETLLTAFANGANVLGITPLPVKSEVVVDAQTDRPADKAVRRCSLKGFW